MSYFTPKPEYRKAEREAFCRVCDKKIVKGDMMVSWFSHRNRGQSIHIHPECVKTLVGLINETPDA